MEKDYTVWKIFGGYMLVLLLMIMSQTTFAQSPCEGDGICVYNSTRDLMKPTK